MPLLQEATELAIKRNNKIIDKLKQTKKIRMVIQKTARWIAYKFNK